MRPILEQTLDKEGWSTYIKNPEAKFSVLVECRQAYEELLEKPYKTWTGNEHTFFDAYSDYVVEILIGEA